MARPRVRVERAADDVSPKVSNPTIGLAILTVITGIISGDINGPEFALAASTIVTAALGYFSADKVDA